MQYEQQGGAGIKQPVTHILFTPACTKQSHLHWYRAAAIRETRFINETTPLTSSQNLDAKSGT